MTTKAIEILNKIAAITQHGKQMEERRAKSQHSYAQASSATNAEYPGMAYLKGTTLVPMIKELSARRNAYTALGPAQTFKAMVPGIGMGAKGKKALEKLVGKDKE